jgi:Zn-dependent peptidase ImmA (M78 family)
MIGSRLKLARAAAGLSLRELEDALDSLVTAQAVGKYERNEMMPSSDVLMALSKALGVSVAFLLSPADVELVGVEFRKKELTSAKDTAEVRARILDEVERYVLIEQILAIEPQPVFPDARRPIVRSLDDVDEAALKLRSQWQLGGDPIPNLCEFLEKKGIKILSLDLPESVSGVQAHVRPAQGHALPVIVVNSKHAGERQRFTMAHELGHLYLKAAGALDIEKACNRFAGAFLIPKEMLVNEIGQHRTDIGMRELFQLKLRFGTSAQAIVYRCKDLGIFGQSLYAQVFKVFNAKGWKLKEPIELPEERPARFERLCLRALAEGVISDGKAAELLRTSVHHLQKLVDQPPEGAQAVSRPRSG